MSENVFDTIISDLEKHEYVFNVDRDVMAETVIPNIFSSVLAGLVIYQDKKRGDRWPCIDGIRLSLQECPYSKGMYSFAMCDADDEEETSKELLLCIIAASHNNVISIERPEIVRIVIKCAYDWMAEYSCGIIAGNRQIFYNRYADDANQYAKSEYMYVQNIVCAEYYK